MQKIKKVLIAPDSLECIKKRKLERQYLKAKEHILLGRWNRSDLKKTKTKNKWNLVFQDK